MMMIMNSKYFMALFLSMIMFSAPVLAIVDVQNTIGDPGTLPNEWSYGFKRFGESLQLMFTFNQERKVELQYEFALRRLGEAQKMSQLGEVEKSLEAMEQYQFQLQDMEQTMLRLQQKGVDTTQLQNQINVGTQLQTQTLTQMNSVNSEAIQDAMQQTTQTQTNVCSTCSCSGKGGNC